MPRRRRNYGKKSMYMSAAGKVIIMRSTWELAFAHWLDKHKIEWLYEPRYFDLGPTLYLPDFYLVKSKVWIEIKGVLTKAADCKMFVFRKMYPNERLYMLRKKDLIALGVLGVSNGR